MNEKKTGLEAFVERQRADFDAFEPRPNLWDEIESQLAAPEAQDEESVRIVKLEPEIAAPEKGAKQGFRYRIAAAAAVLLLAGGGFWLQREAPLQQVGAIWTKSKTVPVVKTPRADEPESFLYLGSSPVATQATEGPAQRLTSAVQRMETYYANQITERQSELRQLDKEAALTPGADWRNELAELDSTYRQLKVELYRNPEPDVVLDAMNRNLQIRLDILNQQLRTRERIQDYHSPATEPAATAAAR
ncbi:hypothetical protein [Hymenobacter sp. BT491]|uniref:hypothetical protein n=1 Tax=Hymenobacter sp. BT491 TaxID=2766779 RepID=UPI001653CADC|nr:hypothetical protein [Hymenobacter sp. BT491]MBC6990821.1 hypothetical protein [Hymenobacter sp. BT491]